MDLVQYKCPCCGAGLQFLPDTQKLSCQSCGNQYDLETIEEYEQEEQADAVLEILNGYRENLVNDTMQYPQNLGKIQASQVEKIGNYVIFVQLGGGAIESGDEEEVLTKCQEANKLALDAIRSNVEG